MNETPLPSKVLIGPKKSLCADSGNNRLFWVPGDKVRTIVEAFDAYLADRFPNEEQESMAFGEYVSRLLRAMHGKLRQSRGSDAEVKRMLEAPGIFEIRWHWNVMEHGLRKFIGARLFHREISEGRKLVAARLMCKKGDIDQLATHYKQTGFAKDADWAIRHSDETQWNEVLRSDLEMPSDE
ncbi:hypothetical protein PT282_00915 [Bifidobacterium sp. ESL0763]|uniref:hypothetical protein n=1 Tax=Bifidobacterium sp. ESL0763 TaxID=2983227 RepID=UPI0023F7773D|nr:hypothetical protein [Bifidobacterium sp. ESL0763]MDF7663243.1 hypothetical protein [Bifidobacterium sp. ESL0763]